MSVRIHRGASEVGGTCVELSSHGRRLVLDAGMPLTTDPSARELLPDVPGMWAPGDGSLLALLLSHTHLDHHGLADLVDDGVPVHLGARAAHSHAEAAFFRPWAPRLRVDATLEHGRTLRLGPFTVTPWRVDHSAPEAFAFHIRAGGRSLVYSGDVRGHGREPETLDRLAAAGRHADVLLLEGTRVGRSAHDDASLSEECLEDACVERIFKSSSAALAFSSAENVDRLVTLHRAARRCGRTLVLDLYAASMWRAAGLPMSTGTESAIKVLVSSRERRRIIETRTYDRLNALRGRRLFLDELGASPHRYVVACRTSAVGELENAGLLHGAEAIWTMWNGYLRRESMAPVLRALRRNGVRLTYLHSSGHADVAALQRLVRAMQPRKIVPIHTAHPDRYAELFAGVHRREDGEWWDV